MNAFHILADLLQYHEHNEKSGQIFISEMKFLFLVKIK